MIVPQLPLRVQLRDDATFENFYPGENRALVNCLLNIFEMQNSNDTLGMHNIYSIYLWSNFSLGKTHLLQAACHLAQEKNLPTIYLSLKDQTLSPEVLDNIESLTLICLDDIDAIENKLIWQEALFHCYNRLQQTKSQLLVAANKLPKFLQFQLPDLISRLCSAVVFQIQPLSDEDKIAALRMRSARRGINLPLPVAKFMLHHYSRNMHALFYALEKLDEMSLISKKKLTIPLVKNFLTR
jgi:DnaA family protein